MARLLSIFLIGLVVFMVIASTTSQWADGRWHSGNSATEWKNGYALPGYGQWSREVNRHQIEQQATEWKNGATQRNSGHLEWKDGRWYWSYGNSELEKGAEDWKNGNSQPGNSYWLRENRQQIDQQAAQWKNAADIRRY